MDNEKQTAEDAYIADHAQAYELLDQIRELLSNMPAPESETPIHWGHVGNISQVNEQLKDIATFLRGE
jgi:hypothetical protein